MPLFGTGSDPEQGEALRSLLAKAQTDRAQL